MAQTVGTVYVEVAPSGKGFGKSIEGDITTAADSGGKAASGSLLTKIGGAFSKIGKLGLGAIGTVTTGIAGLAAKGGFERALSIENAQAKLKGLGHSSSSVTEIMKNALDSVKGTAFGLGDAATVAASLSAAGVTQGAKLTTTLKTVADTAQISGRSLTDIGTIFGSVAARGKIQGDDMLQLMSSGVPVLQFLSKHLKKSSADVSSLVSKGKVSFQDFADAMKEGLGGAALSAGNTFSGALKNVKAALGRTGEMGEKPLLEGLRKSFNSVIPAIDAFNDQLGPLATQLASKLSTAFDHINTRITDFTKKMSDGSLTIQDLAKQGGLLSGGFATLAGAGGGLLKFSGFFTSAESTMSNSLKNIEALLKVPGDATEKMTETVGTSSGIFSSLGKRWQSALTETDSNFGNIFTLLNGRVKSGVSNMGNSIKGALNGKVLAPVKSLGGKLTAPLKALGGKVSGFVSPVTSAFGNAFKGFGGEISTSLQSGLGKVGGVLQKFFNPSSFMKFVGIGALIAALVAGLGMLDQSTGGQLRTMVSGMMTQLGTVVPQAMNTIAIQLPQLISSGTGIIVSILNGLTLALPQLLAAAGRILSNLVVGLAAAMPTLIPAAVAMIATLIQSLVGQIPLLLSAGLQLLNGIVQGIMGALPALISAIPSIISTLLNGITTALPQILQSGMAILDSLIDGIVNAIPQLTAMLPQIIDSLTSFISTNLPQIISAGVKMLDSIVNGIVKAIPQLVAALPKIIDSLINFITTNLPTIISAGVKMLVSLINGLVKAIPQLVAAIPKIIVAIVNGIVTHLPQIISAGGKILTSLATGLVNSVGSLLRVIPGIIRQAKNAFTSIDWGSVGRNIINGIVNGLKAAGNAIWDFLKSIASSALDNVKSFFGIHSPSRVMRDQVGVMIGRGLALGLDKSGQDVIASAERMSQDALSSFDAINGVKLGGSYSASVDGMVTDDTASDTSLLEALLASINAFRAEIGDTIAENAPAMPTERGLNRMIRKAVNV